MKRVLLIGIAVGLLMTTSAWATVWNVDVSNFAFTPSVLTIAHGDTVHWHCSLGFHSVHHVSATSLFGRPAAGAVWDYSFAFNSIGDSTFHYICEIHPTLMMGTITVVAPASITVTSPNGGENWFAGTSKSIQWSSAGFSGNVMIEVNRSYPAGSWETISASSPNTGSLTWVVTGPASSLCRVHVTSIDNPSATDVSNSEFSIHTLSSPQSLVASQNGSDVTLFWSAVSGADGYTVYRSLNPSDSLFSEFVGTTADTTLTDVGVVDANAKYYYQVRAFLNALAAAARPY